MKRGLKDEIEKTGIVSDDYFELDEKRIESFLLCLSLLPFLLNSMKRGLKDDKVERS